MKQVPLNEVKDDLSRYLRMAATENIVITRHGVPAGILIGLEDPEDYWEELLLNTPEFKARISQARANIRQGTYKTLAEVKAKYASDDVKAKSKKKRSVSGASTKRKQRFRVKSVKQDGDREQ
jgi:prevent-host-death family protein